MKVTLLPLALALLIGLATSKAPVNLALNKPVWQVTLQSDWGVASNAVDGNTDSYYPHRSCSCTTRIDKPWLTVDLGCEFLVNEVVITNRRDCCADRLTDFTVSVGNTFDPDNKDSFDPATFTECASIPGQLGAGETRTIACGQPVRGRYVTVNLNRENYLTICELQVHGSPVEKSSD